VVSTQSTTRYDSILFFFFFFFLLPTKFIDGMEREQYCMDQRALSKTVWRQILESIVDDKLALLQRMVDASHR
jgi:hypothetical protein